MIIDKIERYVNDPENAEYNYDLGKEYEGLQQYSAAVGYFLRAADRTHNNSLLYDCVVSAAKSLMDHGDNFMMALNLLDKAIEIDPSRIDAFFLKCLTYKYIGDEEAFKECHAQFLEVKQNNEMVMTYDMMDFTDVMKKDVETIGTVRHSDDQLLKDFKQKIQKEYSVAATTPSDINEHLSVLLELAKECKHITEMGVRTGVSTRVFLLSNAKLVSYDIVSNQNVISLVNEARAAGKDATFIEANVLNVEIEETDLLFIDTWHTYDQLKKELTLHADRARKYIAFHDTNTYGLKNEDKDTSKVSQGLLPAIIEFLIENREWRFKEFRTNNNGLTVLERD